MSARWFIDLVGRPCGRAHLAAIRKAEQPVLFERGMIIVQRLGALARWIACWC